MHSYEALLPLRRGDGHHLGNRDRGGIGGKNSIGLTQFIELSVYLSLLLEVLDDCFNDDVTIGKLFKLRRAREASQSCLLLFSSHRTLLNKSGERSLNSGKTFIDQLIRNFAN